MHEIGVEPELLWQLLLVQIVYDKLVQKNGSNADFASVAHTYTEHPLLPAEAPVLAKAADAKQLYMDLLQEREIDTSIDAISQAQALAEPLYLKFQENLVSRMQEDAAAFENAYRRFEEVYEVPREERLAE